MAPVSTHPASTRPFRLALKRHPPPPPPPEIGESHASLVAGLLLLLCFLCAWRARRLRAERLIKLPTFTPLPLIGRGGRA